jgi:hypothetical protein
MKRVVLILSVCVLVGGLHPVVALDSQGLENDFETLLESLGREIVPHVQQASLMGDALYDAEQEHFGNLFVAFTTGAVFSGGFKDGVESGQYEVLNVPALMDDAFGELPSSISGIYDSFFPYPVIRVAVGANIGGTQFAALVSGLPGQIIASATDDAFDVSALNVGLRGRTFVLEESGPLPAIAVGGGYTFSTMGIAYSLDDFAQDDGAGTLSVQGDFDISSTVNTVGLDLYASKTFAIFVPYLRISPYLQRSRFYGVAQDFDASQGASTYGGDDPEAEVISYDFAVLLSTGFDIKLGKSALYLHGNYGSGTGSFGADLGFRVGF